MGQQVGVSKAAKTLGVTRAELNDRLQAAGIETFEGQVDFEKVKCIAPQLDFGDKNLERLEHIRENPAWRINGGDVKATPKEMADEIRRLSTELMAEVETSASYRRIIEEFAEKLELELLDTRVVRRKRRVVRSKNYRNLAGSVSQTNRGNGDLLFARLDLDQTRFGMLTHGTKYQRGVRVQQ